VTGRAALRRHLDQVAVSPDCRTHVRGYRWRLTACQLRCPAVELADVIVAGLALAVSVWTALDSRASARRSVSAAERSAAAAEREIEMATAYRVVHDVRSAYLLVNDGDEMAEAAMITSSHPALQIIVAGTQPQDVEPHSAVHFTVARGMSASQEPVTVTWRRPGEEETRTWRHPVPYALSIAPL